MYVFAAYNGKCCNHINYDINGTYKECIIKNMTVDTKVRVYPLCWSPGRKNAVVYALVRKRFSLCLYFGWSNLTEIVTFLYKINI